MGEQEHSANEVVASGELSIPQIVETAIGVLQSEVPTGHSMLMSRLGLRLSAKLGPNLREALGGRKLREVLSSSLGEQVAFDGTASNLSVRLNGNGAGRPQRFDPAAWAAFAKVIPEGKSRFLKVTRPIDFKDFEDGTQPPEDWREIDRALIPHPDLSKPERDAAILKSIYAFTETHGVPIPSLLFQSRTTKPAASPVSPRTDRSTAAKGGEALLHLIEAVPEGERARYSLPLDLIQRLLTL